VLRNEPTRIAMSSTREQLAHTTDITPRGSWLHWRTPNQTRAQLILFYPCL